MRAAFANIALLIALVISVSASAQTAAGTFQPGTWKGTWVGNEGQRSDLTSMLTIDGTSPDGLVFGSSAWNDYPPWKVTAGSFTFKKGEVEGNEFIIGRNFPVEMRFVLQPDGSLSGRRIEKGKPAGVIKMVRQ